MIRAINLSTTTGRHTGIGTRTIPRCWPDSLTARASNAGGCMFLCDYVALGTGVAFSWEIIYFVGLKCPTVFKALRRSFFLTQKLVRLCWGEGRFVHNLNRTSFLILLHCWLFLLVLVCLCCDLLSGMLIGSNSAKMCLYGHVMYLGSRWFPLTDSTTQTPNYEHHGLQSTKLLSEHPVLTSCLPKSARTSVHMNDTHH
jgi:hypothetical protein